MCDALCIDYMPTFHEQTTSLPNGRRIGLSCGFRGPRKDFISLDEIFRRNSGGNDPFICTEIVMRLSDVFPAAFCVHHSDAQCDVHNHPIRDRIRFTNDIVVVWFRTAALRIQGYFRSRAVAIHRWMKSHHLIPLHIR